MISVAHIPRRAPAQTSGQPSSGRRRDHDRDPAPPPADRRGLDQRAFPLDDTQPDLVSADGVTAVTDGTHIVATRDSGKHWTAQRLAGLFRTVNAGKTWTLPLTTPNGGNVNDLTFVSASTGFALESTSNAKGKVNTVYRTVNAGQKWTAISVP
ncbi:MAG TPA: hypothetical protein VHU92_14135 [Streptosporangiaceae bacterium]|nr:hypothetical protein [Streptosporangiaceae bacterium]